MIIMMLRGAQLVPVLLVCNMLAFVLNVVMGFIPLSVMITADSPVVHGIEGMVGVVIFTVWIFIQNAFLKEAGLFEVLIEKLGNVTKKPAHAELLAMLVVALTVMMTASGTVSIIVAGPVVYEMFKKFNIDRHRGANYLDGTACGIGAILPWNNSLLIMLGLAVSTGLIPETYSPLNFFPYSFYSFGLLAVYIICAVTGIFRKQDARNYE
jgi:Na+/H+ antiporter NhaC